MYSFYVDTLLIHTYIAGNVIRYLVLRALQLPPEAWSRLAVYNASVTILEVRDLTYQTVRR